MELWDWYKRSHHEAFLHSIPALELDWLIIGLTGSDRLSLRLQTAAISSTQLLELDRLWQLRITTRTPVQYLLKKVTWLDFELTVSPDVLIPRPETELLIDLAKNLDISPCSRLVDLGTGSGAIALGLAQAFPQALIYGVDCSELALEIAKSNAEKYHFGDLLKFYLGHWFEPLQHLQGKITAMISNPPYIPSQEVLNLAPEVRHEPQLALDGGSDGLDSIRYLVETAPKYLISGGNWLIEVMAGQAQIVRSLIEANGSYEDIQIHQDYAGIERFVAARKL